MLRRIVSAALLAAVAGVTVAEAQTLRSIGGPAEMPPADFKGQMFVDSRGCVFLRAGHGGTVNWVARVSRDRKAMCGYPPTMAALGKPVPVADAPAVVAAAPAPKAVGAPIDTVASITTAPKIMAVPVQPERPATSYVPAPVVAAPPSVTVAQAPVMRAPDPIVLAAQPQLAGGQIGCFASAPVPVSVALSNGGAAVLCTRGDGSLNGARAPLYGKVAMGEGDRVGAGLYEPQVRTAKAEASRVSARSTSRTPPPQAMVVVSQPAAASQVVVAQPVKEFFPVPKGYKLAWRDGRLNPQRGVGSAGGQAQMDQVWTREVPAQLVADRGSPTQVVIVSTKSQPAPTRLQVSTKAQAAKPAAQAVAGGRLFVQIGTFGVQANAEAAKARLRAAGLGVGTAKISKGGQPMQIVLAGPFGDTAAAQAALRAARGAGFGDAFIR